LFDFDYFVDLFPWEIITSSNAEVHHVWDVASNCWVLEDSFQATLAGLETHDAQECKAMFYQQLL
jgi:hypothetical protein